MLRLAMAAVLISALVAGCAGSQGAGDAATLGDDSAAQQVGQMLVDLTAESSVGAPSWQPGQWWEWEFTVGAQVLDGTARSIVLTADGSGYTLVTENSAYAKEEAAFGGPLLGPVGKSDLSMQGWGGPAPGATWSLLSFPLTDGKTWSAGMPNIAWDIVPDTTVQLAMTATFEGSIGDIGGFRITGQVDGQTLVEAEYDAATGWFARLAFYDVDPGQEELELQFRAKSAGLNYTGPYFQHTATSLVSFEDPNGFDDVPTEGGQPYTNAPQPHHTFTMKAGTTLFGYIVSISVLGERVAVLIDPANGQRNQMATGQIEDSETVLFLDEPSIAGEWRLLTAGAGGFTMTAAELFEVTEGNFTM